MTKRGAFHVFVARAVLQDRRTSEPHPSTGVCQSHSRVRTSPVDRSDQEPRTSGARQRCSFFGYLLRRSCSDTARERGL
jgi:hypothetical protein